MNKVHYSSKDMTWETPQDLFDEVNRVYKLEIDVCATKSNAKLPKYFSPEMDGLAQNWDGIRGWMNPPYGREIGKWVEKAARGGAAVIVALLPARTDTRWFHEHILHKAEVVFIKGRLKFGGSKNSAPFPSMIVTFK